MRRPLVLALAIPLVLLAGCTDPPAAEPGAPADDDAAPAANGGANGNPPAPAAPTAPKAGTASGRVTTEAGAPVEGAKVTVYGTTFEAGEDVSLDARTDRDGRYSIRVPDGRYAVSGDVEVEYDGQLFLYDLVPKDGRAEDADSEDGIVEDLLWKPTGFMGGTRARDDPSNYYGALIDVHAPFWWSMDTGEEVEDIPDGSTTTLTFRAKGPGIDGTTPAPRTHTMEWPLTSPQPRYVMDVLPATYEVTGTITLPDGTTRPLVLASEVHQPGDSYDFGEPAPEVEVTFLALEYPLSGPSDANVYIVRW